MTKTELWDLFVKRNPHFKTGPIAFTPTSLRKFYDTVWAQSQKAAKPEAHKAAKPKTPMPDFLKEFGKFMEI